MVTAVFDTLHYVKTLESVGVSRDVAEAQAAALTEIVGEQFATKDDINMLRKDTDISIKALETRLNHRIDHLASQLTIRMGSMLAAGVFLLATLNKVL